MVLINFTNVQDNKKKIRYSYVNHQLKLIIDFEKIGEYRIDVFASDFLEGEFKGVLKFTYDVIDNF